MDFADVGIVLLILTCIPIVILLWGVVFFLTDDMLFDGAFQYKIRQWVRDKMEDKENE